MERADPGAAGDGRPAGWLSEPVYLDYNATTPVDTRVAEAARPYWDQWFGNPSSGHAYAERPRQAVTRAREQVATLIGAAPGEIVFTGSGSEADQLAIRGALLAGLRWTGALVMSNPYTSSGNLFCPASSQAVALSSHP